MKVIRLETKPVDRDWAKCFMDESHYDVCYNEDVAVYKPNGDPLLVLVKKGLTKANTEQAWSVLKGLNLKTTNRGSASGMSTKPQPRKDGTLGKSVFASKGWIVESGVIGYFERTVRMPYCRPCAWNAKYPEKFVKILPIAQEVSQLFEKHVPERYAVQKGFADKTCDSYVLPGTVFTTLTINKNFRTACHLDAGDLEAGFSCMSVIRRGIYRGAKLVLPNWRIAVDLEDMDVVMFDAHEWHGNTQLVPITKDAVRCSIVHYYREKMIRCLPVEEELKLAKNRKQGQPLY